MFAYCENNPVRFSDPTGQYRILEDWDPSSIRNTRGFSSNTFLSGISKAFSVTKKWAFKFGNALLQSIDFNFGIGMGIGAVGKIFDVGVDLEKTYNVAELQFNNGRFSLSPVERSNAYLEAAIYKLGWFREEHYDYSQNLIDVTRNDDSCFGLRSIDIFSGALYLGYGCSIRLSINTETFLDCLLN